MDSFELNKIAGAVIAALLVMVASSTIIDISTNGHGDDHHEVVGFKLPTPEAEEAGDSAELGETETAAADAGTGGETSREGDATDGGEAAGGGFDPAAVASAAAGADVGKGEKVFRKCKACHSIDEGGKNKVGPALWGIVGRDIASAEGFGYSDALQGKDGAWSLENLAGFIHAPKDWAPGTKMIFKGIDDNEDLANLLAYLDANK